MIRIETPGLANTPLNVARVNPAAASQNGYGALAKGLADTSEAFAKIAGDIQRTENAHALSSLRNSWSERNAQLTLDLQQEPDPAQHLQMFTQLTDTLRKELDETELRPDIRTAALLDFDRFSSNSRIRNAEGAANLSYKRANLSLQNERQEAYRTGDGYAYLQSLDQRRSSGDILPEQYEAEMQQWDDTQRKKLDEDSMVTNPDKYLEDTRDIKPTDPHYQEIQQRRSRAKTNKRENISNFINSIEENLANNVFESAEDIELYGKDKNLHPSIIRRATKRFYDLNDEKLVMLKASPKFQHTNSAKLDALMATYSPIEEADRDGNIADIQGRINDITNEADKKEANDSFSALKKEGFQRIETVKQRAKDTSHKLLVDGHFGPFEDNRTLGGLANTSLFDWSTLRAYGFNQKHANDLTKKGLSTKERDALFRKLHHIKKGENTLGEDYAQFYSDYAKSKPMSTKYQVRPDKEIDETLERKGKADAKWNRWFQENIDKNPTEEEMDEKYFELMGQPKENSGLNALDLDLTESPTGALLPSIKSPFSSGFQAMRGQ